MHGAEAILYSSCCKLRGKKKQSERINLQAHIPAQLRAFIATLDRACGKYRCDRSFNIYTNIFFSRVVLLGDDNDNDNDNDNEHNHNVSSTRVLRPVGGYASNTSQLTKFLFLLLQINRAVLFIQIQILLFLVSPSCKIAIRNKVLKFYYKIPYVGIYLHSLQDDLLCNYMKTYLHINYIINLKTWLCN